MSTEKVEQTRRPVELHFDVGQERVRKRQHWWQVWIPNHPPPPPPSSLDDAPIIPIANASFFTLLTYSWLTSIMTLGYLRTLQPTDLWKLDESRESTVLSASFDQAWAKRVQDANEWNTRLQRGEIPPSLRLRIWWTLQATWTKRTKEELETRWREKTGRKEASLAWALNDTFGHMFWIAGVYKVVADVTQLMGPLIVKALINFVKKRAHARRAGEPLPNVGDGIGMAIGLFCTTVLFGLCQNQFFWRSMTTGLLARAALISSIYKRGINLTQKARIDLPNSKIINFVSTDVSRIDACAQWFHAAWTAPVQITVCVIILLTQLGPSSLAGFAMFLLIVPIQQRVMSFQYRIRQKANKFSDQRAKIIMEVLSSMRIVKYFCYESSFLKRLFETRRHELRAIRKIQHLRSANLAFAFTIPVLAATVAFVVYTSTEKSFDPAIIFTSLGLFQLLRQPMLFLPRALSGISDAQSALARLTPLFHAELLDGQIVGVDPAQTEALLVKDATFVWASASPSPQKKDKKDITESKAEAQPPFQVMDVNLSISRGELVAITGVVGSGKSSLLQGLIGEMPLLHGRASFGGHIAYCPQTAWIQNATLRENVLFGKPFEEERYRTAISVACLLPDLLILPSGDLTEIGEKGVNLSGGQKQRVSIARAIYANAEVVILDDPLSAVDAHVGRDLFHGAILGNLKKEGKTVLLVTHALHFIRYCDYVCVMNGGKIVEQGTYDQLMENDGEFARLDREFAGEQETRQMNVNTPSDPAETTKDENKKEKTEEPKISPSKERGRLIVEEKRVTGAVSWKVYGNYAKAGKGWITIPLIIVVAILTQGGQILNTYSLVWWQANTFHQSFGFYQMLYAVLGIGQTLFTFGLGFSMDIMASLASQNLHHNSMMHIFYASMSFFDTTPLGRIIGVFGKDIDTIDNLLSVSTRMLMLTICAVLGAVIIIGILLPYFLIVAFFLSLGYASVSHFYKASALETKRLDGMFRSILYSHLSESMTGLPTIRAFGELPWFIKNNQYFIDLEGRALFITVTNQRWLSIRLDLLGACMVLTVGIFCAVGMSGISEAQVGLVLTYIMTLTQACGMLTRQQAEVENYMNSVERVIDYSAGSAVTREPPHEIPSNCPPPSWPDSGNIEFKDVVMKYRPGLPNVLHGISLCIRGGEKIGVVGRTGAGKSSLTLALLRIVELASGSITIDGVDISKIGLKDLRSKISIIPQDPLMFSGTVRSNLDPFSQYDDAQLWDALRRSWLVTTPDSSDQSLPIKSPLAHQRNQITLDTPVEAEGANLSLGQRSLLSLARALVKEAKIVVLDEATASVDLETDSQIQRTIQTQFADRTLLCIAHRLRTILSYDRVLVLDSGKIAEFDTPINLFEQGGIFTSMCVKSNITLHDIQTAVNTVE